MCHVLRILWQNVLTCRATIRIRHSFLKGIDQFQRKKETLNVVSYLASNRSTQKYLQQFISREEKQRIILKLLSHEFDCLWDRYREMEIFEEHLKFDTIQ